MTEKLPLNIIRIDGGTQSRAAINDAAIAEYAEAMRDGIPFPRPVVFHDGADYWLADGFHRFHALRMNGDEAADFDVQQGTRRDAILYSAGANASHGLRRTRDDKRRAVSTLLADEEWSKWSDREIARRCGVGADLVGDVRKTSLSVNDSENRTYTTKHGTVTTMQTAGIGGAAKVIPEVLDMVKGTKLDEGAYLDKLKRLPPNEQVAAAKRDLTNSRRADAAETKTNKGGLETEETSEQGFDPLAVRVFTPAPPDYNGLTADQRISELVDHVAALEADIRGYVAELKTYSEMKVLFETGGFEAVIAAKDELIRGMDTRLYSESADKAEWMRKAKFWEKQAKDLGWRDTRQDSGRTEVPAEYDEAFIAAISGAEG